MKLVLAAIALFAFQARAWETEFQRWQELAVVAEQVDKEEHGLLPKNLTEVHSKDDLLQQIFNYQLKQISLKDKRFEKLDPKFSGSIGASTENSEVAERPSTTYEVKPLDARATVDFDQTVKATFTYKVWSHDSEILVMPDKSYNGVKFGVSHTSTSVDTQDKFVVQYNW